MTAQTKPTRTPAEFFQDIERAKQVLQRVEGQLEDDVIEYRNRRKNELLIKDHEEDVHRLQRELDELQAHCKHERPSIVVKGKHRCPDCFKKEQRHD